VQSQAIICECKGYFVQISPNLPEKLLCDKRSPYNFSVAVGRLYFPLPCCHTLENKKKMVGLLEISLLRITG